jgi:hypothetical protein
MKLQIRMSSWLLVAGFSLTGLHAANAELRWDPECRCERPAISKRVVREPAEIRYRRHYVDHTRYVYRPRVIRENRTIVHVRPVLTRDLVVHRENTLVREFPVHRVSTHHVWVNDYHRQVEHVSIPGWTYVEPLRYSNSCNCGRGLFSR